MKNLTYLIIVLLIASCKKDDSITGYVQPEMSKFTIHERDINYAQANEETPYIEISFDAGGTHTHYTERFYRTYTTNGFFTERTITRHESQNGSAFVKENSWTSSSTNPTFFSWTTDAWKETIVNLTPETITIE